MNLKTLQIISDKLLNEKVVSESNIEHYLMDENLPPRDKVSKIMVELDSLKDSTLKLSFWEEFISKNVIIPKKGEKGLITKRKIIKMEKVNELENLVQAFKDDYEKFKEKGNKTAGTRARKILQEIRNLAKDTRDEISNTKKEMVA